MFAPKITIFGLLVDSLGLHSEHSFRVQGDSQLSLDQLCELQLILLLDGLIGFPDLRILGEWFKLAD